jgi:hypothetical protein
MQVVRAHDHSAPRNRLNEAMPRSDVGLDESSGASSRTSEETQVGESEPGRILKAIAQRTVEANMGHPDDSGGDCRRNRQKSTGHQ